MQQIPVYNLRQICWYGSDTCWVRHKHLHHRRSELIVCILYRYFRSERFIKAHANGPNIVGANNVVTCCVRLHGTTTMLALVATCCV